MDRSTTLHLQRRPEGDEGTSPRLLTRLSRVIKLKNCKWCTELFTPRNSTQVVCSPQCAIPFQRLKQAKKEKREYREKNAGISKLMNLAQREFNKFIRERDRGQPCICCGKYSDTVSANDGVKGGNYDAGHFRTRGAAGHLRFHEDNCHLQLKSCNQGSGGSGSNYRARLIAKIGLGRVEALENNNETRKWTREELVAIRKEYLGKWKAIVKAREA